MDLEARYQEFFSAKIEDLQIAKKTLEPLVQTDIPEKIISVRNEIADAYVQGKISESAYNLLNEKTSGLDKRTSTSFA